MIPQNNPLDINIVNEVVETENIYGTVRTYKMDFKNKRVHGYVDDIQAVQQMVDKILYIERFTYPIYTQGYGIELLSLIGDNFEFVMTVLEGRIKSALSQIDVITGISQLLFKQLDKNSLSVAFEIYTIYGNIETFSEVKL